MANMFPSGEKARLVIPAEYLGERIFRLGESFFFLFVRIQMKLTETLLIRTIPHVHECIGTTRRERAVLFMESDGIDREDILHTILF